MKRFITIAFVLFSCGNVFSQTLLHYWNFNGKINSATSTDTAQSSISIPDSTIGGGAYSYAGSYLDVVSDLGDTVNLRIPVPNWVGPQNALRVRSPYGPFILTLPTSGYENIVVKYGLFRSGSGSHYNTVTYSTDGGVTWDSANLKIKDGANPLTTGLGTYTVDATAVPLDLVTLDFTNITAVNNNANFKVKITFDNTVAGNNRYDNISVDGTAITTTPVELVSFNASKSSNGNILTWIAANENNIQNYVIEKSVDAKTFNPIGSVLSTDAARTTYNFTDKLNATSFNSFYRLKIVSKDGTLKYSNIIVVSESNNKQELTISPNVVKNQFKLTYNEATKGATYKILSIEGKTIVTRNLELGSTQTTVDVSNLRAGNYFVSYENGKETSTVKFVKQ